MRIAVIGSGISGLTAAYHLDARHEVVVYEANSYVGGHTHTVDVETPGGTIAIDTGFIVCNDRTYPNFLRMLRELGVSLRPTAMSLSVRCDAQDIEYRGADLGGLFAQRRNLFRGSHWRMLSDIVRFHAEAKKLFSTLAEDLTIGEFFRRRSYSQAFRERYFLPMGAAIWSCPTGVFQDFPLKFVLTFYEHHGLLGLRHRPQWYVIDGGSRTYVRALTARLRSPIRTQQPIATVERQEGAARVKTAGGEWEAFDRLVFACHSDQALAILGDSATALEREVLGSFPYETNAVLLHTDTQVLPRRRRAWASWNYRVTDPPADKVTVTYNMNLLQGLQAAETYCVTLNDHGRVDRKKVLQEFCYAHPVFTTRRTRAQSQWDAMQGNRASYFCGAYWGNGFHEDGVVSGLRVSAAVEGGEPWKAASTRAGSSIAASTPFPIASVTASS